MRLFPTLALSAALLAGACTDPYGNPDPGATLGLVAGAAALGGLAYLATQGHDDTPRDRDRGYRSARDYDDRPYQGRRGSRGNYRR